MGIAILHVGVPLDHPVVPAEDRERLKARLDGLRREMEAAGYVYEILGVDPDGWRDGWVDGGMEEFKKRLRDRAWDAVLLGGGVVGSPELSYFMERLVNTAHAVAPGAKILFHSHAVTVRETVERWFPAGPA